MSSLRVLLAGGGTGGHVFPAIAVAEELVADDAAASVLFVGAQGGLEERLVPAAGFTLELLAVGKLQGAGWLQRLRTLRGLPPAVWQALTIVRRFDPQIVVGVGGYASGPLALAATLARRPLVLLEQNAVAGATNRVLARLARQVVTSFPGTQGLAPGVGHCLGNPLRRELVARLASRRPLDQAEDRPRRLLIVGGSQGARRLNELGVEVLPALARELGGLELIHQTGAADQEQVSAAYAQAANQQANFHARVEAFIDDMAQAYRWADLVLCRAGATTLAELTVAGLPAVLVPYPHAANDHQAENSREAVEAGGAIMIRQHELDAARLSRTLKGLLADQPRLLHMSRGMRSCARPQAATRVVKLLRELARR